MGFLMNIMGDYMVEIIVIAVVFLIIMLVAGFRIFEKAKIDGYKVLIPLYNLYLFVTIADLPIFVVPLFFIPIINILVFFLVSYRIGERFGKGIIFRIGLCILPFLFYLWLAFSSKCLYKAEEETGRIRAQEQNSTLYNQFPDVEEVVEQPIAPVPLERDVYLSEGPNNGVPIILDDMGISTIGPEVPQVSVQPPVVPMTQELQVPVQSQVAPMTQEPQVPVQSQVAPMTQEPQVSVQPQVAPMTQKLQVSVQPQVNPLGIVEQKNQDNLILDIDSDSPWEDREQKSESELTKKVVTIDPINDDPLFNPDAIPVKAPTLDQYKVCKHCRARLDLDAKICFLCGHRVEEDEE